MAVRPEDTCLLHPDESCFVLTAIDTQPLRVGMDRLLPQVNPLPAPAGCYDAKVRAWFAKYQICAGSRDGKKEEKEQK